MQHQRRRGLIHDEQDALWSSLAANCRTTCLYQHVGPSKPPLRKDAIQSSFSCSEIYGGNGDLKSVSRAFFSAPVGAMRVLDIIGSLGQIQLTKESSWQKIRSVNDYLNIGITYMFLHDLSCAVFGEEGPVTENLVAVFLRKMSKKSIKIEMRHRRLVRSCEEGIC